MKVPLLETHDRLQYFLDDQSKNIFNGLNECLTKNKDAVEMQQFFPYIYVYAHPRTADNGRDKRMVWQPRLIKPKAQTNSYLFRVVSNTDLCEIIWLLPPRELWSNYEKGKVGYSQDVWISIQNFLYKRSELQKPHKDDWSESKIKAKLQEIAAKHNLKPKKSKPVLSGP